MRSFLIFIAVFLIMPLNALTQVVHTAVNDSIKIDTTKSPKEFIDLYKNLLDSNYLLNVKGKPQAFSVLIKKNNHKELYFYVICFLFLLLGIFKTFYSRYFNTLFKVFFNTSLRQNQLTDQLEQAKLPSLIFNGFFIVTGGFYLYYLIRLFSSMPTQSNTYLLFLCIASVGICYTVKYFSILFTGWLTNSKAEANTYIFIIFLLNKVMGVFFLAVLPLLAFGSNSVASYAAFFSFIAISLVFIIRFFRAYSLLQSRLKVSRFHFAIYVTSLEILPLAIIYKFIMLYFNTKS